MLAGYEALNTHTDIKWGGWPDYGTCDGVKLHQVNVISGFGGNRPFGGEGLPRLFSEKPFERKPLRLPQLGSLVPFCTGMTQLAKLPRSNAAVAVFSDASHLIEGRVRVPEMLRVRDALFFPLHMVVRRRIVLGCNQFCALI